MLLKTGLPRFDTVLSNCRVVFDKCVHMLVMLVRRRCTWGLVHFYISFFCIYFSEFCSVGMNAKFVSLFLYCSSVCFLCFYGPCCLIQNKMNDLDVLLNSESLAISGSVLLANFVAPPPLGLRPSRRFPIISGKHHG